MKEYWVNVYDRELYPRVNGNIGKACESHAQAKFVSSCLDAHDTKTLYRIHVRLK